MKGNVLWCKNDTVASLNAGFTYGCFESCVKEMDIPLTQLSKLKTVYSVDPDGEYWYIDWKIV